MATLKDISAHLGLSVTQVSRALNGYSDVSEKTRKRVKDAAKALNYQPNISARKLANGRSGMVAVVRRHFPEITKDTMFFDVITGLSLEFAKRNMELVLHVAPRDNDPVELHRKLYAGGAIDGFVILEPFVDDPRITYLQENNIPFVLHGRSEAKPDYAYFDIDNFAVGRELTQHLIALGHQRIALLNGIEDRGYNIHRHQGYMQALKDATLSYDEHLVKHKRMNTEYGRQAVRELLALQEPPTAIVCGHVQIAKGVYQELAERGLRIPEHMSVVCHDDAITDMETDQFDPPLTVSVSAIENSWVPISEFMERTILGEAPHELQEIEAIELIERASTQPLKEVKR